MEIRMPCHSAPLFPSSLQLKLLIAPPKHILARAQSQPPRVLIPQFSCIAAVIAGRGTSSFCSRIRDVLSELDHNPGPLNVNGVDHKRGIRWLLKMLHVLDCSSSPKLRG